MRFHNNSRSKLPTRNCLLGYPLGSPKSRRASMAIPKRPAEATLMTPRLDQLPVALSRRHPQGGSRLIDCRADSPECLDLLIFGARLWGHVFYIQARLFGIACPLESMTRLVYLFSFCSVLKFVWCVCVADSFKISQVLRATASSGRSWCCLGNFV